MIRLLPILTLGILLLSGLAVLSLALGATSISLGQVLRALGTLVDGVFGGAGPIGGEGDESLSAALVRIVVDLRLPRTLAAIMVGAGLAMVGALLQTITRNDLADPFLFGISSGAAAGAVLVITFTGDLLGVWTLPLAAFGGGLLSAFTVIFLTRQTRGSGPESLVLAGLAVSFIFAAATNVLVFAGDQRAAHAVLFWSLGGFGLSRWDNILFAGFGLVVLTVFAILRHRRLDALLAGEDTAHSLGVDVNRLRTVLFLVVAFATATFVSIAGVIGFVGLMVPHMARPVVGVRHFRLLPLCAMIGALLMLVSDIASRTLLAPQELPIGIITASFGAFFVAGFVMRRGRAR